MARRRKVEWKLGDVFVVPLLDGTFAAGQILSFELSTGIDGIGVVLFGHRLARAEDARTAALTLSDAISIVFVTYDLVESGRWPIVRHAPIAIPRARYPHEDTRAKGWVGASIHGSALVEEFLNAYFALCPWDDWADPNYLDEYLLDPSRRPPNLVFKKR